MDEPVLEKESAEEEEVPVQLEVIVKYSSSRECPLRLGYATSEQVNGIHNLIRAAFDTLAPTKVLTFVDQNGTTWHFNTKHVACIQVITR